MADSSQPPTAFTDRLRLITVASFIPAFPLCLAHGVISNTAVPAVGLLPLAFSASSSLLLWHVARSQSGGGGARDGDDDDSTVQRDGRDWATEVFDALTHPISVFALDAVLAVAFMVVLVFTWTKHSSRGDLSMLAAYATMPLLACFAIHCFLALHALYEGLAIHGLAQWAAWRAVPPDCPSCNTRLRPSFPELPWLQRPGRRDRRSYAPVLVDDAERYRDEPNHEAGPQAQLAVPPAPVEVRRKGGKGRGTPASNGESATPWSP